MEDHWHFIVSHWNLKLLHSLHITKKLLISYWHSKTGGIISWGFTNYKDRSIKLKVHDVSETNRGYTTQATIKALRIQLLN
jgi:hypothetical protein